jgi:hypothetical protein
MRLKNAASITRPIESLILIFVSLFILFQILLFIFLFLLLCGPLVHTSMPSRAAGPT